MDYSNLSLDITLNKMGYNHEDLSDLFKDPFETLYSTRIGYQWHPSTVGWDSLMIVIVIGYAFKSVADSFLNQIGSDFATWSKEALSKVIKRKNDFDNSIIYINFKDKRISIYINNGDEIIETMMKLDKLIRYLQTSEEYSDNEIDIYFGEIKKLEE